ncbi:MAG TPA: biopolymer transporter ExbD [Anaeromyxobacteraceae bacterium]|nr:biopolymer transporter ExbD [Anaeromyxobacteraceae bacterium]
MAVSGMPDVDEREDGAGAGIFADINITPLTDIFLVLLIIFMVTTTAIAEASGQNGGIKVTLPKGGQPQAARDVHDLAIAVLADGRLVVQGKVVDEASLTDVLAKAHQRDPETLVLVQADEGVTHGKVVAVMDLARRQGLPRLAIATRAER